jgi:hypothetical protein
MNVLYGMVLTLLVIGIIYVVIQLCRTAEGFTDTSYKSDASYTTQVKLLADTYSSIGDGKRPVKEKDQIFVNFYSLGCRFAGYIGPSDVTYYDPEIAIQNAVSAGCRTFVLDIDFIETCDDKYFPTLVVRNKDGVLIENIKSRQPKCNTEHYSTIKDVCNKINTYAFSPSCQNGTDPVVLVLYFLRQPPGAFDSVPVLTFYSNVAKMLAPLQDRFLQVELTGKYYRQQQESQLLTNPISTYNNKVLVFSNANTSGFRKSPPKPAEDLDFIVNLRLSYTQTKMGITENGSGSTFGILQTADDYMTIPSDRSDATINATKLKWTICLSTDPMVSVPKETYTTIAETYGVHCVPILLHDIPANQYMFTDKLFKKYSYIQKPEPLQYTKPIVIVPAEPSKKIDGNKGEVRRPR